MNPQKLQTCIQGFVAEAEADARLTPETGIAVSVVHGTEVRYEGTFGYRDRDQKLPVTPKTIFEVSSTTKAFTAVALLSAHEAGRVDLDRPINQSKMILKLQDPEVSRRLSVADILSHRSGLPSHDFLWYFGTEHIENLVSKLGHLDLVPGAFRNSFIYSNLMYATLRVVFESTLHENWSDTVLEKILAPLKMRASSFQPSKKEYDVALPYAGLLRLERKNTNIIAPAGGLRSNIEDMARWMSFHLEKGITPDGRRLLSEASMMRLHAEENRTENFNPLLLNGLEWLGKEPSYGLGWFIGKTRGMKAIYHSGFIDGFSAAIVLLPERKLGFSVLMNANMSSAPGLIIDRILGQVLGEEPPQRSEVTAQPAPPPVSLLHLPASAAGSYVNPAYGAIRIECLPSGSMMIYQGHRWPFHACGDGDAEFVLNASGLQIPIPAKFVEKNGRTETVSILFSFDPRVKPQVFVRTSE